MESPWMGDGRKVEMARERSSAGGRGMSRCSILRGAPTYREPWIQLATYSRQDGSTWEKYHSRLPKLVLDPPSCQQLNSDFQIQQLDAPPPPSLSLFLAVPPLFVSSNIHSHLLQQEPHLAKPHPLQILLHDPNAVRQRTSTSPARSVQQVIHQAPQRPKLLPRRRAMV